MHSGISLSHAGCYLLEFKQSFMLAPSTNTNDAVSCLRSSEHVSSGLTMSFPKTPVDHTFSKGSWQSTILSDWSRGELQSVMEWWCLTAAVRLAQGQSRVGEVTPEPTSKSEITLGWWTYNCQEFCSHEPSESMLYLPYSILSIR